MLGLEDRPRYDRDVITCVLFRLWVSAILLGKFFSELKASQKNTKQICTFVSTEVFIYILGMFQLVVC